MNMQAAAAVDTWEIPADAHLTCDPLLCCLEHVTKLLGRPRSSDALAAGLPLPAQGLTPELFVRGAARAGLSARVVDKNGKVVASRLVETSERLDKVEPAAAVAAFDAAFARIAKELIGWTVQSL